MGDKCSHDAHQIIIMSGRKFNPKQHKDLRDFKNKEIKKSLVHRARLRKNYFKLLDKEQPQRRQQNEDTGDEDIPQEKQQLSYAEKAQIVKERKEQNRKEKLARIQERKNNIERSEKKRERTKEKISRTNKYGQPKMGPRINNLLDKIKKEQ